MRNLSNLALIWTSILSPVSEKDYIYPQKRSTISGKFKTILDKRYRKEVFVIVGFGVRYNGSERYHKEGGLNYKISS